MHNRRDEIMGGDATLRVVGQPDDTLGEFATEILGEYPTEILGNNGDDIVGAWLHKLNPAYWFKSSRERKLLDAEKSYGKMNVAEQKRLREKQKEMAQAEKAVATARAARAAQAESQEAEARLKEMESELTGAFVGGDEPTKQAAAENIVAAKEGQAAARKNAKRAGSIAAKLEAGERLSSDELVRLKSCMRLCRALRRYHDDLHARVKSTTSGYHGPDYVEPTAPSAGYLGEYIATTSDGDFVGGVIPKGRWVAMAAIAATAPPVVLRRYMKKHQISMTARQKGHLANMTKLTKRGLAKKGMSGIIAGNGDDIVGFNVWKGFKKAAAVAALPVAALAYGSYKATVWAGKKVGKAIAKPFRKKGPSAAQARQNRIKAARARRLAALKRQQAAAAETEAARQEAEAAAAAADAEAAASQAEAEAQEAAASAEEAEYGPQEGEGEGEPSAESEGDFVGAFVGDFVGSSFVGADEFMGAWVGEVKDPKKRAVVKAAASNTATGKKIRAGATVVRKARRGDKKAKAAITKVAQKAKAGHPQAKRDLNAIKAGNMALKAKAQAHRQIAAKKAVKAKAIRKVAVTRRLEAVAANRLARMSRKRALVKVARVERRAAAGDRRAKAIIAKTVAKAKTGDKKAKTGVAALKLARRTRTAAKTPREKRNLMAANKLVRRARAGHKPSIKKVRIIQAAARKGQPNAKRALRRMTTAAAVERAVATGKVKPPPKKLTAKDKAALSKKRYAHFKRRALGKNGTREEAIAAAREAKALGMKEEAAALTLVARDKPSATVRLKNAATVAAASKQGNAEGQQTVADALQRAEAGDPAGIKAAGDLTAVNALQSVKNGQGLPPQVAEAVNTVRAAQAGDPEKQRTVERASQAAQAGDPAGVQAAVALGAGAALLAATASRPQARKDLVSEANKAQGIAVLPADKQAAQAQLGMLYAKVSRGEATREEAERARQLAMGMGNTRLAAEIATLMPPPDLGDPRSSLPDVPLPAINTVGDLVKESLKALLLSTRDPFANYREGVQSRGSMALPPPSNRRG